MFTQFLTTCPLLLDRPYVIGFYSVVFTVGISGMQGKDIRAASYAVACVHLKLKAWIQTNYLSGCNLLRCFSWLENEEEWEVTEIYGNPTLFPQNG